MATYATLTVTVRDIIGADFHESRASVWIEPNTPNGLILADGIRVGGRREQLVGGTATFANLVTTNSADNPTSFGYRVTISAPPKGASKREDMIVLTTSDFPLTGNANLASISAAWDGIAIPPNWQSDFLDQAQAILDQQEAIAGANTADDLITILDANPASTFRVQQDARLAATIAASPEVVRRVDKGIYENFTDANFRAFRAGLARAMAGGPPARISVYGDSNSNGFMNIEGLTSLPGGSDYTRSYGARAQAALEGFSGLASRTGVVFTRIKHTANTYTRADARFTLGNGWGTLDDANYGPAGMGAIQGTGPTAGELAYTFPEDGDTIDIFYARQSTAATSVSFKLNGLDALIYAQDNFAGSEVIADGSIDETNKIVSVSGTGSGGSGTWRKDKGTLFGNKTGTNDLLWVVDSRSANGIVSMRNPAYLYAGVVFRYVDASNYWIVARNGSNQYILAKKVAGTTTVVKSSTVAATEGDLVAITMSGSNISVAVNGAAVTALDATDAALSTATRHGARISGAAGQTARFSEFKHAAPAGTTVDLTGTDSLRRIRLQAPTVGKHTLTADIISGGTATILAVESFKSGSPSLRWTLGGYNSGTATHWNTVSSAPWGNEAMSFFIADPDLVIVNLMINAHNAAQSVATYKADMGTFVDSCLGSGASVLLIASAAGGNGSAATWSDYLNALRELAAEKGCGLLNMQQRWGDYATASAAGLWNDADHPSYMGYGDLGVAVAEAVKLAAGRAA